MTADLTPERVSEVAAEIEADLPPDPPVRPAGLSQRYARVAAPLAEVVEIWLVDAAGRKVAGANINPVTLVPGSDVTIPGITFSFT